VDFRRFGWQSSLGGKWASIAKDLDLGQIIFPPHPQGSSEEVKERVGEFEPRMEAEDEHKYSGASKVDASEFIQFICGRFKRSAARTDLFTFT